MPFAGAHASGTCPKDEEDLAAQHADLDITMRVCRYTHRISAWKNPPCVLFVSISRVVDAIEVPGHFVGS
jgi:hypothetical protein